MYIHEPFVWAIDGHDLSGIYIYCQDDQKEEIKCFLEKTFAEEWHNAVSKVEEEVGEEVEDIWGPMDIICVETGLFADIGTLDIRYGYGDFCDDEYGNDALEHTFEKLEKEYPDIQYEGYIAYAWSDLHGGEVTQYGVHSKNLKVKDAYDFIGYALEFLDFEELYEDTEDFDDWKSLICLIALHAEWIDVEKVYIRILDFFGDVDEEMREELTELIESIRSGKKEVSEADCLPADCLPDDWPDGYLPGGFEDDMELKEYEKELIKTLKQLKDQKNTKC